MSLIKDQVDRLVKALKYQIVSLCKGSLGNLESADKIPAICSDDTDRAIYIALQSSRHLGNSLKVHNCQYIFIFWLAT